MRQVFVVAAVTVLCLAGVGPAWAVFPGQNGRIAYQDNGTIHTILPSGLDDRAIGQGIGATWSPNGRRIAFINGQGIDTDLYTMRADGSDVRRLTFDGRNAGGLNYSPGGGRLVFLHYRHDSRVEAVVMRTDGSDRHTIATLTNLDDPTWSPAGGEIAFTTGDSGQLLRAMRPDGTHRHRLVRLGSDSGLGPIYSPDGSTFLFARYWDDGTQRMRLADAHGSHVRQAPCARALLAPSTTPGGRGHVPITYSPDGRWILVNAAAGPRRVELGSCTGRAVGAVGDGTDWQALPAP